MPEIKGDYNGRLKTIKATADAKLETVTAIDAGSAIIGNIDRVATVGDIAHLGSIGNTQFDIGRVGTIADIDHLGSIGNTSFDQGAVSEHRRDMYIYSSGSWAPSKGTAGYQKVLLRAELNGFSGPLKLASYNALKTAPAICDDLSYGLSVNTEGELILATLGTVERVKDIDNLGTVGKLETIGMIESGTISEVGHVGTVGDITHLGSIANTMFDVGRVGTIADIEHLGSIGNVNQIDFIGTCMSRLHAKTFVGGVWTNLYQQDDGLMTSPGKYGSNHYPLSLNANHELKTAPATSRKGVVQTVANAGTAIALVASSTPCIGVIVQADYENLGTIYVGDSTVDDTHGFKLRRDKFISFSCQNAGSVYIDASRNAQKVSALYINY